MMLIVCDSSSMRVIDYLKVKTTNDFVGLSDEYRNFRFMEPGYMPKWSKLYGSGAVWYVNNGYS